VRTLGAGGDTSRLLQQHRGRRALGDEGEGAVRIRGDDDRGRETRLELGGCGVERLAELHDVQATLAQRRTDGRGRIGLPGLDLQLDVADDFLCHGCGSLRVLAPFRLPIGPGKSRVPASRCPDRTKGRTWAANAVTRLPGAGSRLV